MDPVPVCHEKDALVAYLYDECEPAARERFEAHLATCQACADEVDSLRSVRGTLETWMPSEPPLGFRIVSEADAPPRPWWRVGLQPAWGLAMAATLVVVVAAAIASVEVRYGNEGFVFRMGWTDVSADVAAAEAPGDTTASAAPAEASPWGADLAALETMLRRDLGTRPVDADAATAVATAARPRSVPVAAEARAPAGVGTDELLRQIQTLIAQSERRQQQEFASGLLTLAQEFEVQRQADQLRVQQEFGRFDNIADYLVRISGR